MQTPRRPGRTDLSATDGAYMAGLIDGEGSIQARHRPGGHGGFDYSVVISNTDEAMIRWVQDCWGGSVILIVPKKAHHKLQWRWAVWGQQAATVARAALPYLITKRAQADLLLELAATSRKAGEPRDYTDEQRAHKLDLIAQIAALNRRGKS